MKEDEANPVVRYDPLQNEVAAFELAQRKAKMLAASSLLPEAFRGNIANVMMVMNLAHRLDLDPLMVAQGIYFVSGKPSWNSQFIGALIAHSGRFGTIRFAIKPLGKVKFKVGKEEITIDDVECRALLKEKESGEIIEGPECTLSMAHKEGWFGRSGSKWQSMPMLMLRYRSVAFAARVHCPDILCGLPTDNELQDIMPHERRRPRLSSVSAVAPEEPPPPLPPEDNPDQAKFPFTEKEMEAAEEWANKQADVPAADAVKPEAVP